MDISDTRKMIHSKRGTQLITKIPLNIANYPETANGYHGIGDWYPANGEKAKEIESFKKTITIRLIPETKEKLETLLKE